MKTKIALTFIVSCFLACKAPAPLIQHKAANVQVLESNRQKELLNQWESPKRTFQTLLVKGRSNINWQGKTYEVRLQYRIQQDEAIWISMQAPLIGEIGRVWITRDQISMINRLDKTYIKTTYDEAPWLGPSLRHFEAIQALLTGEVASKWLQEPSLLIYPQDGGFWVEWQTKEGSQALYTPIEPTLHFFRYQSSTDQNQLLSRYQYKRRSFQKKIIFPSSIFLEAFWNGGNFSADSQIQSIQIDEPIEMPFTIPATYKLMQ